MKCRLVNENYSSNYLENLLQARGIENVQDYITPTKNFIQSPSGLDNILQGAECLWATIEKNGKILLIVDSDVDGFTSSAIIYQYIHKINKDITIDYFLHEGKQHGLEDHIENILESEKHYDLVILPDSSSNDIEFHDQLGEIGTTCLVLDHHLTDKPLSDNAIIINNQLSERYQNKELTGAGVVYQFCRFFDEHYNFNYSESFIDLAALGICGDMGSALSMENRYIMVEGFKNIKNFFFQILCEKQDFSMGGKINPISVAFYIVPLINAMIRVGTMDEKSRLFEAFIDGQKLVPSNKRGAKGTMERVAIESARECTNAHAKQKRILDNAINSIEAKIFKHDLLANKILFVRLDEDDDFPPVLNGLVAMRLSTKFKKPTIVARLNDEGYCRGSMRGLNQSALKSFKTFLVNSGYFEYVMGHDNAAGASILNSNLENFHDYANFTLWDIDFGENVYDVNFERAANSSDLNVLVEDLCRWDGLWGQMNSEPLIYITDIFVKKNDFQIMGKNKDTVKFEKNGIAYMFFHAKEFIAKLNELGDEIRLEVVGRPNLNEWGGRITPQIFVSDYEIKTSSIFDF